MKHPYVYGCEYPYSYLTRAESTGHWMRLLWGEGCRWSLSFQHIWWEVSPSMFPLPLVFCHVHCLKASQSRSPWYPTPLSTVKRTWLYLWDESIISPASPRKLCKWNLPPTAEAQTSIRIYFIPLQDKTSVHFLLVEVVHVVFTLDHALFAPMALPSTQEAVGRHVMSPSPYCSLHDRPLNWDMSCWNKEEWLYSENRQTEKTLDSCPKEPSSLS